KDKISGLFRINPFSYCKF
ncbi:hypothetical protein TNCT_682371, partial [Trichonephila clavata]